MPVAMKSNGGKIDHSPWVLQRGTCGTPEIGKFLTVGGFRHFQEQKSSWKIDFFDLLISAYLHVEASHGFSRKQAVDLLDKICDDMMLKPDNGFTIYNAPQPQRHLFPSREAVGI